MAKSTGNAAADRVVAAYWLVSKGQASKADVDKVIHQELQGKTTAEIKAMYAAIEQSMS
ncbi:hypothetical protein [Streptomyces nigrescens]